MLDSRKPKPFWNPVWRLSQRHTWRFYTPIAAIGCSDCDFRRSPRSAYKIADIWHVRYRRLNSQSVPVPVIFYVYCCESPVKPTHQVGRFITWVFKTATSPRSAEKNGQVCPHQSSAIFAGDRRIKSPGVSLALGYKFLLTFWLYSVALTYFFFSTQDDMNLWIKNILESTSDKTAEGAGDDSSPGKKADKRGGSGRFGKRKSKNMEEKK